MAATGPDSLQIRVTALLAVIAATTWWLTDLFNDEDTTPAVAASDGADYYLKQVSITLLDALGEPRYRLDATDAEHLPSRSETQLNNVNLDYFPLGDLAWNVTSELAIIPDSHDSVELDGGVVVKRLDQPIPTVVRAKSMTVLPNEQRAMTQNETIVEHQFGQVIAGALQADLERGELKLSAPVKGRYEPL